jgi:hypothetical protein
MTAVFDLHDAYELDGIQVFALNRALDLMGQFEDCTEDKRTIAAANTYAAIARAAGQRLALLGGIPEECELCEDCQEQTTAPLTLASTEGS